MTLTFYQWLRQFRKQDNAIGDIARDAVEDSCFPRKSKNRKTILKHVVEPDDEHFFHPNGCDDNCRTALIRALDRYEKEVFTNN